jgi:hypothetical protein
MFLPYGIVGTWRLKRLDVKNGWKRITGMFSKKE